MCAVGLSTFIEASTVASFESRIVSIEARRKVSGIVGLCSLFFFQAEDGIRDHCVTWSSDVCSSDLGPSLRQVKRTERDGWPIHKNLPIHSVAPFMQPHRMCGHSRKARTTFV